MYFTGFLLVRAAGVPSTGTTNGRPPDRQVR